MKKIIKIKKRVYCTIAALIAAMTCLAGCSDVITPTKNVTVVSIEKIATEGLNDVYEIKYSDGSVSSLTVTNGKDGKDGKDAESLSVDDLYEKYIELHPDGNFDEFLKTFSAASQSSDTAAINSALLSSAKVFTEFTEYRISSAAPMLVTAMYSGSAVVYRVDDDYTYLITNFHVIYDKSAVEEDKIAKKITCYLYGSEGVPVATQEKDENGCNVYDYGDYAIDCEYVGGSATSDIALVRAETSRVKSVNPSVLAAEFADGYSVGETAIAIGNPESEGISVTRGIVSVDNEYITLSVDGTARSYRSIRIDTSIYSGSSGGGLFNADGKLIGITNAGDGNDQNVNYAVPLPIVAGTVENIMHYASPDCKSVKKITLGVTVVSKNSKFVYDAKTDQGRIVEDVTVDAIIENSIISKIDILKGDVIKEFLINGESLSISRLFHIGDALLGIRSGDRIGFKVDRDGEEITTNEYVVRVEDIVAVA